MIYQITLEAFHDSSALTFIRTVSGLSKNLLCTMSFFFFFFSFEHISSAHFNKFSAFGFAGISTIPPSIMGCCSLAEFYMGLLSHPLIKITFEFFKCWEYKCYIFNTHLASGTSNFQEQRAVYLTCRNRGTFSIRDTGSPFKPGS